MFFLRLRCFLRIAHGDHLSNLIGYIQLIPTERILWVKKEKPAITRELYSQPCEASRFASSTTGNPKRVRGVSREWREDNIFAPFGSAVYL